MSDDLVVREAEEPLHDGFFRLRRHRFRHRRFDGGWSEPVVRELLHVGSAVVVVPYDPVRDVVVMVEQLRLGAVVAGRADPRLLECVAGFLEPGEDPAGTARRETREETGLDVGEVRFVRRWLASPGITDEQIVLFFARVEARGDGTIHGLAEEAEDIRVHVIQAEAAIALLDDPRLDNAHALVALGAFARARDDLRRAWSGG